jgi:hypothetical protein
VIHFLSISDSWYRRTYIVSLIRNHLQNRPPRVWVHPVFPCLCDSRKRKSRIKTARTRHLLGFSEEPRAFYGRLELGRDLPRSPGQICTNIDSGTRVSNFALEQETRYPSRHFPSIRFHFHRLLRNEPAITIW